MQHKELVIKEKKGEQRWEKVEDWTSSACIYTLSKAQNNRTKKIGSSHLCQRAGSCEEGKRCGDGHRKPPLIYCSLSLGSSSDNAPRSHQNTHSHTLAHAEPRHVVVGLSTVKVTHNKHALMWLTGVAVGQQRYGLIISVSTDVCCRWTSAFSKKCRFQFHGNPVIWRSKSDGYQPYSSSILMFTITLATSGLIYYKAHS